MRDGVAIGGDGFLEYGFGVWGWTGLVCRLVGQVLVLGRLCWGIRVWDMELGGADMCLGGQICALVGS